LQLLEFSQLAAVVRSVRLDDFSGGTLKERLTNDEALETMVRSHNRVIEAIHARQAMLPAKFGTVHAHTDDVLSAIAPAHDQLVRQLNHLEGCDEWAVHLYADRDLLTERISVEDPAICRLREQRATARPGRAYFLEQQIREQMESATERQLSALAETAFDRISAFAVDGQLSEFQSGEDAGELDETRAVGASNEGLRIEFSGPYPTYSFAAWEHEEAP
jgi:hypothetical protein